MTNDNYIKSTCECGNIYDGIRSELFSITQSISKNESPFSICVIYLNFRDMYGINDGFVKGFKGSKTGALISELCYLVKFENIYFAILSPSRSELDTLCCSKFYYIQNLLALAIFDYAQL